ncbi:hypothetical protein SPRG_12625 [Saprolegnia parasitica CBS 223.65]|uniref:Uncharacterized protein n=1 Tax=Saprolegnia parasitica (strain CBS 223.65) TaxID=695850 RepID=A0A067BU74_SAPPC|nr:hypothetical protein SPRG_12625 [Saprolegnia parasitica CBS 223.65]KDO21808.1 hypothetical protein SPRG_12625 [Saprolegnia parasitica CBS 223.65]|eukprot:XP_012207485.1 hypothetical protein SPRG_12625 [Saprolegnia parasitica CBS 223.65]
MGTTSTIFLRISGKRLAVDTTLEPNTLAKLRDYLTEQGHMKAHDRFILFLYKRQLPAKEMYVPYEVEPDCEGSIPMSALYEFKYPNAGVILPHTKKMHDTTPAPPPPRCQRAYY